MSLDDLQLGKHVDYPTEYDAGLLRAIPRKRPTKGGSGAPGGFDLWRCYELSWIAPNNLPVSGVAEITYESSTPNIVESKSLKLFLGSMNGKTFAESGEVTREISCRLAETVEAKDVKVRVLSPGQWGLLLPAPIDGTCLDEADAKGGILSEDGLPEEAFASERSEETLYTNCFRALCPVTRQPDWATVEISYRGPKIRREALLRYLISFRSQKCFHEDCCERIFEQLHKRKDGTTRMDELKVICHFMRRGGIDLTPVRFTEGYKTSGIIRTLRQ
ncbi:MAG: NADPH-dependent 7-cyano-7-deazaguanine reductase QueF [Deltaproteobacteria bacterium]|nr:NADPH-dependent 7-cyano-7-deazaguanine reductase QueF [Deltaproteobacteria bacterium]